MPLKLDLKDIHLPILLLSLVISVIGIFFIYSTTHNSNLSNLFVKQIIWLALSLFVCILVLNIDYHELVRLAPLLYLILVATLGLLLLIGKLIAGVTSWFLFEWVAFQPSEFGKIIIILYLAKYIAELDRP
jgi:rod shape determining protein RodA